jgi:uncharacterized glyoxalase superfamily protein PhnB
MELSTRWATFASGTPRAEVESDTYVFVDDAETLCREFEAKGAVILRGLQDEPYGLRDFVVEDPEGHRLVFGTPTGQKRTFDFRFG